MLAFGLSVLGQALYKVLRPVMPGVETMGSSAGWRWPLILSASASFTDTAATTST